MTVGKAVRWTLMVFGIIFLSLYIAEGTGYYEYQNHEKTALTREQIVKFEEDIKNGENIELKDYLEYEKKDYNNKMAETGLNLSKKIENTYKKGMDYVFTFLNRLVGE